MRFIISFFDNNETYPLFLDCNLVGFHEILCFFLTNPILPFQLFEFPREAFRTMFHAVNSSKFIVSQKIIRSRTASSQAPFYSRDKAVAERVAHPPPREPLPQQRGEEELGGGDWPHVHPGTLTLPVLLLRDVFV